MIRRRDNHQMPRITAMLAERDLTTRIVAAEFHMDERNAICYLRALHADGKAHIASWLPYAVPVYRSGPGVDVPKPARKLRGDRTREADAKQKRLARARKKFANYAGITSVVAYSLGVQA